MSPNLIVKGRDLMEPIHESLFKKHDECTTYFWNTDSSSESLDPLHNGVNLYIGH